MNERADVVVIGAGALGASAAYHLARQGAGRVILIDKHEVASQNSRRAAGLTAQVRGTDVMTQLAARSVKAVTRFSEEVGEPLVYHQTGSMKIARRPQDVVQIEREIERGQRLGIGIERLEPEDARRLVPYLETSGILAISYTPTDIYLEPSQLPLGFARAAERLGTKVLGNTMATNIEIENGRVAGIATNRGTIATDTIVDAAGAWSRLVAAMGGAALPVVPTRHQLIITEPIEGVRPTQPVVRVVDANIYFRPEGSGLLIGGYEPDSVQYDMSAFPGDFQVSDVPLDLEPLNALTASVVEQFPIFRHLNVREHRAGLPTMTPDGRQMAGPIPGIQGLWVASGCCVGGLSISPAVGEGIATWILSGSAPFGLDFLSPERFQDVSFTDADLRQQCDWQYSHRYISH